MSEKKKENTPRKKEIWKKIRGFLAMVMVAVISIAGTLAYLSTKSDKKINTFTATENIKLDLEEPDFDPEEDGKDYQPDKEIAKNPQLLNITADDSSEWVIMRIDYLVEDQGEKPATKYKTVTYDDITANNETSDKWEGANIKGLIDFDKDKATGTVKGINSDKNWFRLTAAQAQAYFDQADNNEKPTYDALAGQKCEYFIYKCALSGEENIVSGDNLSTATVANPAATTITGSKTTPLFNKVTIKEQKQIVQNGWNLDDLPDFQIVAVGGAIKNLDDGVEIADKKLVLPADGAVATDATTKKIIKGLISLLVTENPDLNYGVDSQP
ncbi:MAG: hypothetical protein HFJ09_09960 [Lachnospiraceae bacterium]|nr:hypothetical protein [Lachnospiraceae bacterium]